MENVSKVSKEALRDAYAKRMRDKEHEQDSKAYRERCDIMGYFGERHTRMMRNGFRTR